MLTPERNAVISGIGISRIGRRTAIPALELTIESCAKAVEDAGLTLDQIDGLTSLGDTPPAEARAAMGIQARYQGGGFDTGGLLSPVMSNLPGRVRGPGPPRAGVPDGADDGRRVHPPGR